MAKQSPADRKVTELEERLADLRDERSDIAHGLEQIDGQLAAVTVAGDESAQLDELRQERALDGQRLRELDGAIPVLERQVVEARDEAARAERQAHLRRAWEAAAERAALAAAIDDKLHEVGVLWDRLVQQTNIENAALRAAGAGVGTGTTLLNRLTFVIPNVLWCHLGTMLSAARFERINGARWQTLSSFVAAPKAQPLRSDGSRAA